MSKTANAGAQKMTQPLNPKDRLIVALDVADPDKALALAQQLSGTVGALKVGFELFTRGGPDLVARLIDRGHRVFLDLKFHDIPNTVARASLSVASMGVVMFNVHVSGGIEMMTAAVTALESIHPKPIALGVTVLTSLGAQDLAQLKMPGTPLDRVIHYAKLAKVAGLDGVVASAKEAAVIKKACGEDFYVVTPGIRPAGADTGDQKRIMTPEKAIRNGADFLVVGRPIHAAPDPKQAAAAIVDQIEAALLD